MKATIKILFAALLAFSFQSCSEEAHVIADQGLFEFMDETSFEVNSYEFYDHETLGNYDLVDTYEQLYLTFVDDQVFVTKIELRDGSETVYGEAMATNFTAGTLQGIWVDQYTYMEVASLDRTAEGRVVIELEGQHEGHKQFQTIFIVMQALDVHPAAALQISGLPG